VIFVILLLSVFLGDFLLKKYVEARLPEGEEKKILGGRILIRKVHNRGIALGALADRPVMVRRGTLGLIGALAVYFVVLLCRKGNAVRKTGVALLLGGALCNWYDRFHQGCVTDYFSFQVKWKKLKRLVFNLSDICIFAGMLLTLAGGGKRKK
jgi:signal peptidase II